MPAASPAASVTAREAAPGAARMCGKRRQRHGGRHRRQSRGRRVEPQRLGKSHHGRPREAPGRRYLHGGIDGRKDRWAAWACLTVARWGIPRDGGHVLLLICVAPAAALWPGLSIMPPAVAATGAAITGSY